MKQYICDLCNGLIRTKDYYVVTLKHVPMQNGTYNTSDYEAEQRYDVCQKCKEDAYDKPKS